MKVLVIGSGAREHALVWKLAQSEAVSKLFCAPGNPGIGELAECVPIAVSDHLSLSKFAREAGIDLTVVGPEDPLVGGIVDRFTRRGMRIFGPTQRAARLEGSKSFAKELMLRHGIPTGSARTFRDYELVRQYLATAQEPMVIKADGLAAGKGVEVCETVEQAREAAKRMMREGQFGAAGSTIVIEEFLRGQEVSMLAISDGHTIIPFPPARDHKPIGDGDTGPNTGGMGAVSPVPGLRPDVQSEIERDVVVQAIHAMNREGEEFRGCLFAGVMLTEDGVRVLEFNVRFGDPECQTLVRRLKSDLFPLLWHTCDGTLDTCEVEWDERPCVTVVLASAGYPGKPAGPVRIRGMDAARDVSGVEVFHAGTKMQLGELHTSGGRVLSVTAVRDNADAARDAAYEAARRIDFSGKQMRTDIGAAGRRS